MRSSGIFNVRDLVKPARLVNPSGISSLGTMPDGAPIILLMISSAAPRLLHALMAPFYVMLLVYACQSELEN